MTAYGENKNFRGWEELLGKIQEMNEKIEEEKREKERITRQAVDAVIDFTVNHPQEMMDILTYGARKKPKIPKKSE